MSLIMASAGGPIRIKKGDRVVYGRPQKGGKVRRSTLVFFGGPPGFSMGARSPWRRKAWTAKLVAEAMKEELEKRELEGARSELSPTLEAMFDEHDAQMEEFEAKAKKIASERGLRIPLTNWRITTSTG